MIRYTIVLLALALSVTSVACGGSQAPAKDPSSTDPNAAKTDDKPPAGNAPPSLGLGGTGTGSAQGSNNMGH
jgi:hypothetical protein